MRISILGCLLFVVAGIAQDVSTWGTTPGTYSWGTTSGWGTTSDSWGTTTPATYSWGTTSGWGTTSDFWGTTATVTIPTEGTTPTVIAATTPPVTIPTVGTEPTSTPSSVTTVLPGSTTIVATTVVPTTISPPVCRPGCELDFDSLTVSSMRFFPIFCETVCTNTTLRIGYECDMTEKQLNETLKNMKHLIGGLLISRSKFKSARFLANLETLDCRNLWEFKVSLNANMTELGMLNLMQVSCPVTFTSNVNMTRLNVPKMIPVWSPYYPNYTLSVEVAYNAPTFCISLEEISNFMTYDYIKLSNIQGNFCPISVSPSNSSTSSDEKTCDLQNYTWSNMSTDCVNVYGDVIIDYTNDHSAQHLASVENIFGTLFIYRTNLSSIDFLGNLKRIVSLTENQQALIVEQNTALTNVSFPSLERVYSRAYVPVRFDNNSLELIKDPDFCYDIRNGITETDTWIVKFDDKVCEDVEKAAAALVVKDKSARCCGLNPVLIITALFGALF